MPETPKKIAFISTQKQDPDSQFSSYQKLENRAKYVSFLNFLLLGSRRAVFGVISFFAAVLLPLSFANAGILSFMDDMFYDLRFSKEFFGIPANSQTMPLLEAVRNSDPSADSGDSDVIVDDSAVLANMMPQVGDDKFPGVVPASDQISVYVVRKGDTLSAIAQMFNVSANTIRWSNDIPRGDGVKVGQKLVILPVSGVQYAIKKGDTVAKIAALYKADADELRSFNGMEEDEKLAVGDTIIIPNGVELEAPPITPKKGTRGYVPDNFSFVATDGYFVRPTAGRKTQGLHGNCHCGVDFHADKGTAVVAAAAGTVVVSRSSGWNGGYGRYIVIKHGNGTQTLYAHLSGNVAAEGQNVYQGQIIAYSGATGKSFGPHLHFEVRGGRNPF